MSTPAWIALAAAAITGTQAWIALRKLRFDLFEKRFAAYEEMNETINKRYADIGDRGSSEDRLPDPDVLRRFWSAQRKMAVLFPVDVSDTVKRIDKALLDCDLAGIEFRSLSRVALYSNPKEMRDRYEDWMRADEKLRQAQNELLELVDRYVRQYGRVELAGVYVRRWLAQHQPWIKVARIWRSWRHKA